MGEDEFMGEDYMNTFTGKKRKLGQAHNTLFGGTISGEVKLAITLRCLAGGSYQDLSLIYSTGVSYFYDIVHKVCRDWINNDEILPYLGENYLNNTDEMKRVAREFELKGGSRGILRGVIGALDGWLVRIQRPTLKDGIVNPGGFFNRKGFFAVNVQVLGDRYRRIIWRSIMCRGAEHDSTAFKRTSLYKKLMQKASLLSELGLYIVCDSAYALQSFLLCPFGKAVPYSEEDTFKY